MRFAEMWTYTVHQLIFLIHIFRNLLLIILVSMIANLQRQISNVLNA